MANLNCFALIRFSVPGLKGSMEKSHLNHPRNKLHCILIPSLLLKLCCNPCLGANEYGDR